MPTMTCGHGFQGSGCSFRCTQRISGLAVQHAACRAWWEECGGREASISFLCLGATLGANDLEGTWSGGTLPSFCTASALGMLAQTSECAGPAMTALMQGACWTSHALHTLMQVQAWP